MSAPLFELQHILQQYNGRPVLELESLKIEKGRIVGLSGHNGSGKSTLLRLLAMLEKPVQGKVLVDGRNSDGRESELRRRITLLLQMPYLLKRSVFANVSYGLAIRGLGNKRERVEQALEMVGLDPASFGKRAWHELSGGEAQRVALASRLVLQPEVLLLDEPTSSLDEESTERIQQASIAARDMWGATLVIVSHDRTWLHEVSDEIVHLRKGRLSEPGRGHRQHPAA